MPSNAKPHWIVSTHHRMRSAAFAYAFVFCGIYLWKGGFSVFYWLALAFQMLAYPHLVYWRALKSSDTHQAELDNLLMDSALWGVWAAALGFPLWIVFTLFMTSLMNSAISMGPKGSQRSALAFCAGVLLGLAVFGLQSLHLQDTLVNVLSMLGLGGYLIGIGHLSFQRNMALRSLRENLKHSEVALQQANEDLRERLGEIQNLQDKLEDQANHDPLTGVFNRRYLKTTLERELARCRRDEIPLTLMMLDVDHFKSINDCYGHLVGDEMLRKLGIILKRSARAEDFPCRYGGEEFVMLFPGMTSDIALQRAEQLRLAFETTVVPSPYGEVRTTLSIGVASYPVHANEQDALIHCADLALYAVKHRGRNGVLLYNDSIQQPRRGQAPVAVLPPVIAS
jgi:diguanylate cyclase